MSMNVRWSAVKEEKEKSFATFRGFKYGQSRSRAALTTEESGLWLGAGKGS